MRILVYKRTHSGDPDARGCFGAFDCMGSVRNRAFEAVIGVGGLGDEAISNDIAGKVTWIGIGPHKRNVSSKRGPEVYFDHFLYLGTAGEDFATAAPTLAHRIYTNKIRHIMDGLSPGESAEALTLVETARNAPPSPGLEQLKRRRKAVVHCVPTIRSTTGIKLAQRRKRICRPAKSLAGDIT